MTIVREKRLLRQRMAGLRSSLEPDEHAVKSRRICERIWEWMFKDPEALDGVHRFAVAAYMPHRAEVDVTPLIEFCWAHGIRVAVPRVADRSRAELAMHWIRSYDDLETGAYGIREPKAGTPEVEDPGQFGLIFVPGLAFDETFARLGYGGGYYDRLISRIVQKNRRPMLVAPAFDLQIIPRIPVESHDVRMDAIVTESRLFARVSEPFLDTRP